MRNAYISALYELAKTNKQIFALVSDNGAIVYDKYRESFPERFINFGIAESNMVSVAAGLAACGKIPFAYTISTFITMRAYEQIRNDVCMQKMNVKLVGIGAGFVYSNLGPTHHNVEDIALMRVLPDMVIFSPADPLESRKITFASAQIEGPVYLRLATGGSPAVYEGDYDFEVGRGVTLKEGSDVTVIGTGGIVHDALQAVEELEGQGITVRLVNIHTLKPIDKEIILKAADDTRAIITVEEHSITGGLGGSVAEILLENNKMPLLFKRMGLDNAFPSGYGTYTEMKETNSLSKNNIVNEIKKLYQRKKIELKDL